MRRAGCWRGREGAEPTLGRVVYPTREQFGAAMLEALTLEMQRSSRLSGCGS